jgi:hypothetical protein
MNYNLPDFLGFSKSKARRALVALFFTNPDHRGLSKQPG